MLCKQTDKRRKKNGSKQQNTESWVNMYYCLAEAGELYILYKSLKVKKKQDLSEICWLSAQVLYLEVGTNTWTFGL